MGNFSFKWTQSYYKTSNLEVQKRLHFQKNILRTIQTTKLLKYFRHRERHESKMKEAPDGMTDVTKRKRSSKVNMNRQKVQGWT